MRTLPFLLSMLAAASLARAQTYAPSIDYPVPCFPIDVEWSDLDLDGDLDLVSVAGAAVEVRLTNSNGTLGPVTPVVVNGRPIQDVECIDVDQDGYPDLVTTHPFAGAGITSIDVIRNVLGTTLPAPFLGAITVVTSPASTPNDVVECEVDGDTWPDIAVTDTAAGTVAVYVHGGSPVAAYTSGAITVPVGVNPGEIVSCDLNNDGLIDLVTSDAGGAGMPRSVTAIRNGFHPVYLPTIIPLPGTVGLGVPRTQAVCTDVDGDGMLDVVATHLNGISVALNLGGTFAFSFLPATGIAGLAGTSYSALDTSDVDGDGDLDLVAGHALAASIEILTFAAGGFTPSATLVALSNVADLECADHDADGDEDFVASTIAGPAGPCGISLFVDTTIPPALIYPGTPDSLVLDSSVLPSFPTFTSGPLNDVKPVTNGQTLQVRVSDPAATFSTALLYVVGLPTGSVLTQPLPGIWFTVPPAVLLSAGPLPGTYALTIPPTPNLLGTSLWFQAYSISAAAANGSYAATEVHELQFF